MSIRNLATIILMIGGLATVSLANCHNVVTFLIETNAIDVAKQTLRDDFVTDVFTDSNGRKTP